MLELILEAAILVDVGGKEKPRFVSGGDFRGFILPPPRAARYVFHKFFKPQLPLLLVLPLLPALPWMDGHAS